MGRHTGWLAGAASLAAGADCNGPDIILLPERPFDENVFLEKVAQLEKDRHNVIIAASEGVKTRTAFSCVIWYPQQASWMLLAIKPFCPAPAATWRI